MAEIITLSIKDFRAIKEADIKLNGITVVAGVNGCGKSTLSKLLYYTFRTANRYELLVDKYLLEELTEIQQFSDLLKWEIIKLKKKDPNLKMQMFPGLDIVNIKTVEELLFPLQNLQKDYQELLAEDSPITFGSQQRIIRILINILGGNSEENTFSSLMDKLYKRTEEIFNNVNTIRNERPISLLERELIKVFADSALPQAFNVTEYGSNIIGNESQTVSPVYTVQKVAYIDTPMSIGIEGHKQDYWDDLNEIIKNQTISTEYSSISQLLRTEILQGESRFEKGDFRNDRFSFTSNNGSVYNLLECATGIKSFSILQLMLKNGFLSPNTLLIIDEPEAHLHPQWIVEYARIIVLLNKEIGVKFFITSHNPDMVSAIKYISEKEGISPSLNFYLAEQTDKDSESYSYKPLGKEIGAIFESFNIALDKIDLYGAEEDDNIL